MCPKSPRSSPPSLAIAPTICRGSTLCRLPTAIRYVAIGTSERRRRGLRPGAAAGRRGRCGGPSRGPSCRPLALPSKAAAAPARAREPSAAGGRPGTSTASAAAMSVGRARRARARSRAISVAEERRPGRVASASVIASAELGHPGVVDVLDAWAAASAVSGWRVARSIGLEQVPLARGDERDRLAAPPGAAGAADAVHVGLGVGRDVVVDHVRDPLHVEAARGDVGGDQDVELAARGAGRWCARAAPARCRR